MNANTLCHLAGLKLRKGSGGHFSRLSGGREGELCVPLSCIIDYLGFRVLAAAVAPIDSSTLVYGCSTAGTPLMYKPACIHLASVRLVTGR